MSETPRRNSLQTNPFWSYRDPHSGRWITVMTSAQWQQVPGQAFAPKVRKSPFSKRRDSDSPPMSAS
ncbi:hypothetical protein PN498_24430 [Oscillatoria sp. CS-180]|nr:hypothetical protein [Oscillatoria sp. CS-180]